MMSRHSQPTRELPVDTQSANGSSGKAKQQFFPMTNWAAVLQAGRSDFSVSGVAQDELLRVYLPALRSYLLRVRCVSLDHVEDVLQGFVADKILRGGLFKKADRTRGRFRNLVLKSLNNYVATWFVKRARFPTVGVDVDDIPDVSIGAEQTAHFDEDWARQTVTAALECMKAECMKKSRGDVWDIFCSRVVRPAYQDMPEVSYEELVAKFNLASPREAINLLITAKRMFIRCLRETIGRYTADAGDVEGELADLRGILMRSRNQGCMTW